MSRDGVNVSEAEHENKRVKGNTDVWQYFGSKMVAVEDINISLQRSILVKPQYEGPQYQRYSTSCQLPLLPEGALNWVCLG